MSVVISGDLALAEVQSGGGTIDSDNPIIGYDNLVTTGNVSSDTAATGYPVTNIANSSTALIWKGTLASPAVDEYVVLNLQTAELVDYVGIARHNFHTAQIAVSIEVLNETTSPDTWDELTSPAIPPNDGPLIFRFTAQGIAQVRIRMQSGTAAPYMGVVYSGSLLALQRKLGVGHTPINYARSSRVMSARSEAGDFLGRIILNEMTSNKLALENLSPAWYRAYLAPFILASRAEPFFIAWRPSSYPNECGFCWVTNDPKPSNQLPNGFMQVDFELAGIFE